jgi:DNA (cytosine-5)-methyltransferase 1
MRYLSVCSGIEAATAAWHSLGWEAAAFSEIEAFPRAVLTHHCPDTPLHGDFTTIGADEYGAIDLLVGGTPCQSFSVAGLRGGLADERGNLALEYLRLADRARPRWLVWENVPGVLSSNGGRDFGTFLGGLAQLGYGWAYRVLDAQFFGVPQRRRRVFVVGHLGDWRRAAAVLFERHSLSGHPAPRREKGQAASRSFGFGSHASSDGEATNSSHAAGGPVGFGLVEEATPALRAGRTQAIASTGEISHCLNAGGMGRQDYETETPIAHSLRAEGFDASEDGTGRGTPLVPVAAIQERAVSENPDAGPGGAGYRTDGQAYTPEARSVPQSVAFSIMPMNSGKDYKARETDVAQPLMAGGPVGGNQGGDFVCHANAAVMPAVAFDLRGREGGAQFEGPHDTANIRAASGGSSRSYIAGSVETMYGVSHADAAQTYPDQALRALREQVGEKAYSEWGAGILAAFRTPEVLRSAVHGGGFRLPTDDGHKLDDDALSRQEAGAGGAVLALWQAGCVGRAPRGWKPSEQLAVELVAHLSKLPCERASAQRFLLALWRTSEGLGLLREALSALQEAWRPAQGEGQPARLNSAVRRLTPIECERLMGFPDDFTLVPYRGKQAADGPRYKALGNSMAVPVMRWIGERIELVEQLHTQLARAA